MITQAILNSQPKIIREVSVPANTQLVIQEANAARDDAVEAAEVAIEAATQTNQDAQQTALDVIQTTNNKNDAETAKNQAQAAAQQTALDVTQTTADKNDAENSKNLASDYAAEAEVFAEIAAAAKLIFTTTSEGIAATNDTVNKYFYVPKPSPDSAFCDLYHNVASAAVYVNTYPSSSLITALQQTADDAGVHARAAALSITLGGTDPEIINAIQTAGGYFNFLSTDNLLSGVVRTDFQAFDAVTCSRASSALALNNAGVYQTFATNVLRKTNKGVLLEGAATNLVPSPTNFSGTGWTGSHTKTTGIASPNGGSDATSFTQTGATDAGLILAFTPASAGDYYVSYILKKGVTRYTVFIFSGGGYASAQAFNVDWDAVGSPTVGTAGVGQPKAYSIETISGGYYRVKFLIKPTTTAAMSLQVRTSSDGTYANRGVGASASQIVYTLWHAQIEAGTRCTSPILTAGTRSADIATITWTGSGQTTDSASVNYGTSQSTTLTRAAFADSTKFNLISDNGAWLGSYITSIVLTPSQSADFRTVNQRDIDAVSTLVAGSISPLVAAMRSVLAANGFGWMSQRFGGRNTIEATDNGATPYLYEDGSLHYWNGHAYGTEAAMLTAMGGVRASTTVTAGPYIDSVDLLGGISFAASEGGFEAISANSVLTHSGGKLIHTASANPNGFRMNLKGFSGKAFAFKSTCRRTTAGGTTLRITKINDAFGGSQLTSIPTALTDVQVIGSVGAGANFWIGGYQSGGTVGVTEFSDARLYEAMPMQDFPNGNFTLYLEGVAPATLPSSTEVLAQGDTGVNNDRFRVELRSDGSVYLVQDSAFGVAGVAQQNSIQVGTMTANTAYKLAVGLNRSQIIGGCNGSSAQTDTPLSTAIAYLRIGRSLAGETFSGTITKYAVYAQTEKEGWYKRITTLTSPAQAIARTPRRLLLNGDSYMAAGTTGLGLMLDDLGYSSINLGVGGSTFTEQYNVVAARTDLHPLTYIWWDGSPNGHTGGQIAIELDHIQDILAAMGHNRWLYIRSGQIPLAPPATEYADMEALYNRLKELYGETHVYNAQPFLATLAITNPDDAGYANDALDVSRGQYPRSLLYDGVHLNASARRALALDIHKKIEAMRQLI